MNRAIFLSASVPDPKRSPEFTKTSDTVAITAAVSALLYVTLGRRPLVWGGHPAITPMVWVTASDIGVDYSSWVKLYQSRYFEDEFPEDNNRFKNVVYVDAVEGDREASLLAMRTQMFRENEFSAAVFIGGMAGILDEFSLFREIQPQARILPVASTGGASLVVGQMMHDYPQDLDVNLDYISVLHRLLDVSVKENRYNAPTQQPSILQDRFWKKV